MTVEQDGETCQRCGEVGHDRRTLWMACMYAMEETGVPFEQVQVKDHTYALDHMESCLLFDGGPTVERAVFTDGPRHDEAWTRGFYLLRVCKPCRADWMQAIQGWFKAAPIREDEGDTEATIPIRDMGTTRMVTREEYERLYPGRVPLTISRD